MATITITIETEKDRKYMREFIGEDDVGFLEAGADGTYLIRDVHLRPLLHLIEEQKIDDYENAENDERFDAQMRRDP
jgi:hypothetical protein